MLTLSYTLAVKRHYRKQDMPHLTTMMLSLTVQLDGETLSFVFLLCSSHVLGGLALA
jgi:hypothetical protein